jgi:hypothetical protein
MTIGMLKSGFIWDSILETTEKLPAEPPIAIKLNILSNASILL